MTQTMQSPVYVVAPIEPDFAFGVLRRTFNERTNDTVTFTRQKLHPIASAAAGARAWLPTAYRHDVLLPHDASDCLGSARILTETFEEQSRPDQRDLALVIKITLADDRPLHQGWESVRSYAHQALVRDRQLAVVLAMHVPRLSGMRSANPAHIHVIALSRELRDGVFGEFSTLTHDAGQVPLASEWAKARVA